MSNTNTEKGISAEQLDHIVFGTITSCIKGYIDDTDIKILIEVEDVRHAFCLLDENVPSYMLVDELFDYFIDEGAYKAEKLSRELANAVIRIKKEIGRSSQYEQ